MRFYLNQIIWLSYHETWEEGEAELRDERLKDVSPVKESLILTNSERKWDHGLLLTVCKLSGLMFAGCKNENENENEVSERGELVRSEKKGFLPR